jgi:hypothetical protein
LKPDFWQCRVAHENHLGDTTVRLERHTGAIDDHTTSVVGAHDIHSDSHRQKRARTWSARAIEKAKISRVRRS